MMKSTGLSHLFKWENLHNWWLTKYFFAPLYIILEIINPLSYLKMSKVKSTCGQDWGNGVGVLGIRWYFHS